METPTLTRREFLAAAAALGCGSAAAEPARPLECSYWVHASLGLLTQKGYFGPDYPASTPPTEGEVRNAARLLGEEYGANRLYLVYHQEMPETEARRVFLWWRNAAPKGVDLVPSLVLRMYDKPQTRVFTPEALDRLARFLRDELRCRELAVYDIYPNRDAADDLRLLSRHFPAGLVRLGQQPEEPILPPYSRVVQDTWSGFCHGKRNREDWEQPGFGAETLRKWVRARNAGTVPVTWNLVTVAWDYLPTDRGGFPGYDDAEKNMPLPAERNRLGLRLVREAAEARVLGGFSSDLYILNENSRSAAHDGREGAFYQTLKRGVPYRGYYGTPLHEIAALYRELQRR